MDVKYIHNFLRVVQTGSMSEAARQLDLSPSAIAQQMRVLETGLGAALLAPLHQLTPGDFAAALRQHRFAPLADAPALLKVLQAECALKENAGQRIGFV